MNVLLRSSSCSRYPKAVLSDFGCAAQDGTPGWDDKDAMIGTFMWQPPPDPGTFAASRRLVRLGNHPCPLCRLDGPVGPAPPGVRESKWVNVPEARRPRGAGSHHFPALDGCLGTALMMRKDSRTFADLLHRYLKDIARMARERNHVADKSFAPWAFSV